MEQTITKKYQYILFDLDGTLTYSHEGIFNCVRYALECLHYPAPDEHRLRLCIGPPLMYSFEKIFGMDEQTAALAVVKYRERYKDKGVYENRPVDGALDLLSRLKEAGYTLALATSKPKVFADKVVNAFGFAPLLSAAAGSGTDGSFETKAAVIKEAMRLLNASVSDCLMVGDRKHDAEGARVCGMDFAAIKAGYAPDGELEAEQPDYLFADLAELTQNLLLAKGR